MARRGRGKRSSVVRRRRRGNGRLLAGSASEPALLRHSEALVVSLRGHASPSPASRACAMGGGCGPLGRHCPAEVECLVNRLGGLRCRLRAIVKIDAVFAGQAGDGDPELAQLGRCDLERGGGQVVHAQGLAHNRRSGKFAA